MTLYDTARCYSIICILGAWHMIHCMVAGIEEAIIELSSVTIDREAGNNLNKKLESHEMNEPLPLMGKRTRT